MFDTPLRRSLGTPLTVTARMLDRRWITPDRITMAGLAIGLASAVCAALHLWLIAAALWLLSRLFDGLDGSLARLRIGRGEVNSGTAGFLDITADFIVYGATVLGVGIGVTTAFGAPWWPFVAVWLLIPTAAWVIAIVWAFFVSISAIQRIVSGYRALK